MVVRAGNRILGLAPLMLERARMYGIGVRRIQFLHNDHTPKADVIVADRADEVVRGAVEDAAEPAGAVGCAAAQPAAVRLADARADCARCRHGSGYPTALWLSDDSPYLELSSNWNTYLGGLGSKLRQNIRNRIGRLTKLGEPSLQVMSDREAIREARDQAPHARSVGMEA